MLLFQKIAENHQADLNLPNDSFALFGRLKVSFINGTWTAAEEIFSKVSEQTFPAENYSYSEISAKGYAIGAYDEGQCVGLAIFEKSWNSYDYLADLKVSQQFRGRGVGQGLIKFALREIQTQDGAGIFTICQDNNLGACRFYLGAGFVIGGLDTEVYRHTSQAGKSDIYFYLD